MAEERRFDVPGEMKKMMREWQACIDLRDHCIKSVFRAKKAIYYGGQAVEINDKFWKLATELHIDMGTGNWSYDLEDHFIYNTDDRKEK